MSQASTSPNQNANQTLALSLPLSFSPTWDRRRPPQPVKCESDADCAGITCGVHPQRWANGAYKGGVEQGSCGDHIAWVSAGGACAGGWTTGEFPDAHPFFCGESVANGMRANMYGCHGGEFAHSGYTPGASDTSCGCPDWENDNYGLKV